MTTTSNSQADAVRQQFLGSAPGDPPALQNHPTQSATAIDGWKSFLFGLPFLCAGVLVCYAALNAVPTRKHAPDWLIGMIGSFFLFGGIFFTTHGLLGILRRAAYNRQVAAHPDQPWLADHHWHREGVSFSAFHAMLGRLLGAIGWNAFLVPFFWVGWNLHGPGRVFLVFAALFALIGLIFWARWIQMLAELLRYGNSFLALDCFPYFMGSTLQVRLRAPRHFGSLEQLTVIFRCVQEKYVTRGMGNNRSTQVVCYELYKDTASFTQEQLAGAASSFLPISFSIPPDQPTTRLSDTPPVYWEVEANGQGKGASYEAYFLVPVYQAP